MMPRLFIGYDADESLAYSVFSHSVMRHSSHPVSVTPLSLGSLKLVFDRKREELQSTEFAFSRFLVPFLCGYQGWAIYADCDMLCRGDLCELWMMRSERYSVQVVKHEQSVAPGSKFLGNVNSAYERKNWSSVMMFNNAKCRALTPEYVANAKGLDLHQFRWLGDGEEIGSLPATWNHLVGVDEPDPKASLVHFTLGMPFFRGYGECEFAGEWRAERDRMMSYRGHGDEGTGLFRAGMSAR